MENKTALETRLDTSSTFINFPMALPTCLLLEPNASIYLILYTKPVLHHKMEEAPKPRQENYLLG